MRRKKEKNISINNDNYKEYIELYKTINNMSMSTEEHDYSCKFLIHEFMIFFAGMIVIIGTMPFLSTNAITFEFLILDGAIIITGGKGLLTIKKLRNEKMDRVKEKFQYIDTDVSKGKLKEALVTYENYLKEKEIKANYSEETKYDRYIINPPIEQEELEKVKEKVKSLGRR